MTATYQGTTAGTTSANPPVVLDGIVGGKFNSPGVLTTRPMGGRVWLYSSTNTPADMTAAGVITDGGLLNMAPGDFFLGVFNGGAATTDAYPYLGIVNSTQSSLSTGAYNITTNYTT